jgi:hypothetical protein
MISLERPTLQINFAAALEIIRTTYLQDALFKTIKTLNISEIDQELVRYSKSEDLSLIASKGLRGEVIFAIPLILNCNPRLLGYYRLLLGYSQKAFYSSDTGIGPFRSMEESGTITISCKARLDELCRSLNNAASIMINSLSKNSLTIAFLDDLALLTLGPQLRGGANVKKGIGGTAFVFESIKKIVNSSIVSSTKKIIIIKNAAGRKVIIEFAADPDIIIRELINPKKRDYRNIIAIEIKGGTDFSNIHNRIGEAEKSHQKAKANGFVECWTVINVDRFNVTTARQESPTTNRFYLLSGIINEDSNEFQNFRDRLIALTGIRSAKGVKKEIE